MCDYSFFEVVAVNLRDFDRSMGNSHAVLHHEIGEARAINQNNSLHRTGKLDGMWHKAGSCDENSLICALTSKCAVESLDDFTPYRTLPSLGLDKHLLQTQPIERDDPVDATVAGPSDVLKISAASSVTHGM